MVKRESITIANEGIEDIIINEKTGEQTNEPFAADDLSSFEVCKLQQRLLGNRVNSRGNGIAYTTFLFNKRTQSPIFDSVSPPVFAPLPNSNTFDLLKF